ncbi:MAG: hypothetical protein LBG17_07240 [Bacteroidales bacterium]|jgi:hypothetical protein|nr:hypothetical protein [Bacteroidales bacterium]
MKNLFKNLKPELKRSAYKSLSEALFLVIAGSAFCAFFLYEILTGAVSKDDYSIITSFLLFGGILLFGIWRLLTIKKNIKSVININSKEYRIFKKGDKFKFILYAGFKKFLTTTIILLSFYFFGVLKLPDESNLLEFLLVFLLVAIIYILVAGFIEYDKIRHTKIEQ